MRLTYKDQYGRWYSDGSKASLRLGYEDWPSILWGDAVDKLAAYEDAEEQGRLVKVRHGQWIFQTYEYMPWCTKAICSSCKQTIANNADLSQDWGKRLFLKDNLFCAKCGAKMEGGKNE